MRSPPTDERVASEEVYDSKAHGRRYDDDQRTRALLLLAETGSVKAAAKAVGATRRTVRRWARRAGLEPREGRKYDRQAILDAIDRGASVPEIRKAFGCCERYARGVKSGELPP